MKLEHKNPFNLKPNTWNSNVVTRDNLNKLKKSLESLGSFKPVVCRELDTGELEILGGFHRTEMAKELGLETIPVWNLGTIPDDKAKQISLVDNKRYGEDDPELLNKLMSEIEDLALLEEITPLEIDIDNDLTIPELIDDLITETSSNDEDYKTLKFRLETDKAEEIENILIQVANKHSYKHPDGYSNLAEALYHKLILEKE